MADRKQDEKDEKSRPFVFRVAKEEAEKLVKVAVAMGVTPGSWHEASSSAKSA